jgi:alanine racemase
VTAPLRLLLDADALCGNWRALARMSGAAACGAAVKADGYGLGAADVVRRLARAGARDFFVATWAEAAVLAPLGVSVSVLHGVRAEDMGAALAGPHPVQHGVRAGECCAHILGPHPVQHSPARRGRC